MDNTRKIHITKLCLVVVSYILAYFYVSTFWEYNLSNPLRGTLISVAFSLAVVIWNEIIMWIQRLEKKWEVEKKSVIEARFWEFILMGLAGLRCFGVEEDYSILLMHIVVVYMVLAGSGKLFHAESSVYLPADLINGFCRTPFMNFVVRIQTVLESIKGLIKRKDDAAEEYLAKSRRTVVVLISTVFIVLAIIVFFFVFSLLGEVDQSFSIAYDEFFKFLDNLITLDFNDVVNIICSIPVGAYLSGLFLGVLRRDNGFEKRFSNAIDSNYKKAKLIPAPIFYIVCLAYVILYTVFIASQARLLFSGFAGILPEEFTASRYAVEGFEQLITVIIINFIGLGLMRLFSSKSVIDSKITMAGGIALMATSAMFAVISASKILLYISRFGYTDARAISLWATVVVFAGTILQCVNIVTSKKTMKIWMYFAAIAYLVMPVIAGFCQM